MKSNKTLSAIALLTLLALPGCGGDDGGGTTGPSTPATSITGTFRGPYIVSQSGQSAAFTGTLQLTQTGSSVSGTLTTTSARSASVSGTVVSSSRFDMSFTFTDGCDGSGSATVDITSGATRLVGNFSLNDCTGSATGTFDVAKQ